MGTSATAAVTSVVFSSSYAVQSLAVGTAALSLGVLEYTLQQAVLWKNMNEGA